MHTCFPLLVVLTICICAEADPCTDKGSAHKDPVKLSSSEIKIIVIKN